MLSKILAIPPSNGVYLFSTVDPEPDFATSPDAFVDSAPTDTAERVYVSLVEAFARNQADHLDGDDVQFICTRAGRGAADFAADVSELIAIERAMELSRQQFEAAMQAAKDRAQFLSQT